MDKTVYLKENHRFRALYNRGRTAGTRLVAVYVLKNRKEPGNKLGITVSKKIGCAVQRNRVRRRIREIYRLHEGQVISGVDIVVVARSASVAADYHALEADMLRAFTRLGLIEEETNG